MNKILIAVASVAVSFAAAAEKMPPLPEGAFTMAVIPDTQSYDGEDWLRLFRFRPDKGVVEVLTYSPSQDRLCDDAGFWHGRSWHQFELPLPDPQNRPVFWYNI